MKRALPPVQFIGRHHSLQDFINEISKSTDQLASLHQQENHKKRGQSKINKEPRSHMKYIYIVVVHSSWNETGAYLSLLWRSVTNYKYFCILFNLFSLFQISSEYVNITFDNICTFPISVHFNRHDICQRSTIWTHNLCLKSVHELIERICTFSASPWLMVNRIIMRATDERRPWP